MRKPTALATLLGTLLGTATILAASGAAHADEVAGVAAAAPAPTTSIGARVGGYGFRQAAGVEREHTGWEACRMNGIGLFGTRTLSRHFFVEAGLDAYFADDFGTEWRDPGEPPADEWKVDRVSGLGTVAGGVRFFPGARVSPYVQLGVGLEITRVTVIEGPELSDSFALPLGFIGIGGDLRLGRARLGANLRIAAMGYFPQGPGDTALDPELELAAQGQFYALFDL